jgi:hypothetical protein
MFPDNLVFQWRGALKLADYLGMKDVHDRCISFLQTRISTMSPAERIFIGRELGLSEVFIQALNTLVTRSEIINDREAYLIGAKTAFRIMQLREQVINPDSDYYKKYGTIATAINWAFRAELRDMGAHVDQTNQPDILKGYSDETENNYKPIPSMRESLNEHLFLHQKAIYDHASATNATIFQVEFDA